MTSSAGPGTRAAMLTTAQLSGPQRRSLVLFSWTLVAVGVAAHDGTYTIATLLLVTLGTLAAVLTCVVSVPGRRGARLYRLAARMPESGGAAVAAAAVGLSPLVYHMHYTATRTAWWWISQVLSAGAGPLAAVTLLPRVGRWRLTPETATRLFWTALGLALAAGAAMILAAPDPRIDVYYLLQGSTKGLLHGADMYEQQWAPSRAVYHSTGLFDVYPYLPWTSVLLLPARLVTGDVRFGLLVCLGLAVLVARRLAGPGTATSGETARDGGLRVLLFAPLLLAVFPKVNYVNLQAWTEPLLVALLAGFVLAVVRRRMLLAVACLALAVASKQHIALLLPVVALWPAFGLRRTLVVAGSAAALVLPWVLADPSAFWHDAVRFNLDMGYRHDALCLPTFLHRTLGMSVGFGLFALGLAVAYVLAWRMRGSAYGFCLGGASLVLLLDLTNKQSFFNHYTLGMGLLVLACVTVSSRTAPA